MMIESSVAASTDATEVAAVTSASPSAATTKTEQPAAHQSAPLLLVTSAEQVEPRTALGGAGGRL